MTASTAASVGTTNVAGASVSTQLQKRIISVSFTFGNVLDGAGNPTSQARNFTGTSSNMVTFTGPRVSAAIRAIGGNSQGSCDLRIYGLTLDHMNQLTVYGTPLLTNVQGNTVSVSAGTTQSGLSIVYAGPIARAVPDFGGAPDVAFQVTGLQALAAALRSTAPTSYPGSADVATIMTNLAAQIPPNGALLANSGVQVRLTNPYFWGSVYSQIEQCAEAAGINYYLDSSGDGKAVLAIWPKGGSRNTAAGGTIPLISAATGMVGYPTPTPMGVNVTTVFNPSLVFGSLVKIQSTLPSCTGTFQIFQMEHNLESEIPGGAWFTRLETYRELGKVPLIF